MERTAGQHMERTARLQWRKGQCVSGPCAKLTVRGSARAARPRGRAVRCAPRRFTASPARVTRARCVRPPPALSRTACTCARSCSHTRTQCVRPTHAARAAYPNLPQPGPGNRLQGLPMTIHSSRVGCRYVLYSRSVRFAWAPSSARKVKMPACTPACKFELLLDVSRVKKT